MSDIRANKISNASGNGPINLHKQSAAKAWVNFNGTNTVAVRDSMNVASITDNRTGDYTASFSQNMASMNYSASITTGHTNDINIANRACCVSTTTSSNISAGVYTATGGARIDMDYNNFIIHGDLA